MIYKNCDYILSEVAVQAIIDISFVIGVVFIIFMIHACIKPQKTSNHSFNCGSAISCDCQPGAKTCDCIYIDDNGNEKSVVCANK